MSEEGAEVEAAGTGRSGAEERKALAEKRKKALRDAHASFEERLAKAERDVEEIKEKLGMK